MILTGDKVSVKASRSKIIEFLTTPSNLEHLLPMDKVKDFVSDETSCSFKVQGGFIISLIQDGSEEDKVFLDIKCSVGPNPFPNLDLAIS